MILKVEPERIGKLNLEKRGGSGPDGNLAPDPRTTTSLNRKSRVVE
jgi:hypothetical protein